MRDLRPCGTLAAYRRHQRHGEEPCWSCRQANARAAQDRDRTEQNARNRRRYAELRALGLSSSEASRLRFRSSYLPRGR